MATLNDTLNGWTLVADYSAIPSMGYKVYRTPDGQEKIVQPQMSGGGNVADGAGGTFGGDLSGTTVYDQNYTLNQTMADRFDPSGEFTNSFLMKPDDNKNLALFLAAVGGMQFLPGGMLNAGAAGGAAGSAAPFESGFVGTEALSGGAGAAGGAGGVTVGGAMSTGLPTATALPAAGAMGGGTSLSGGGLLSSLGLGDVSLGSLAGPLASVAGGAMASSAAGKASDAQVQAAREAAALNEPFRQGGMAGMNRLLDLLGLSSNTGAEGFGSAARDFSMADFQADPGFQFRREEGEKGLQRAAAANGSFGSGRFLKDAMRFNQGLASDEFQNAFNRFQVNRTNKLNPLQSLMGAGQTSANTIGNFTSQAGDARAAGIMGRSNAINDAIGQGFSMYQGQKNADRQNALLEMMLQRG